MKLHFLKKSLSLTTFLIVSLNSYSQFWKDIGKAASDVARGAVKVTTAPYESMLNVGKFIDRGNVSQIYQPYQSAVAKVGKAVGSSTSAIMNPQQDLYNKAQNFAAQIGGPASFVFDVATFSNQYFNSLGFSGGQYLANVMQGQNPLQVNALPLSAALRAANQRFSKIAQPIPDDVKSALRGKVSDVVLNRAKYAIGKLEISLPNMLNFLNVKLNNVENHAVTVDDIIVFYHDPGSFQSSSCHWTHELMHVKQYSDWGYEEFAWKFLNTHPIEKEANQAATNILGYLCDSGTETFLGLAGGSSSTGQNYQSGIAQPVLYNQATQEIYVAQCFFQNNQYPAYYLLTNTGRLIASNIYDNNTQHIGYSDKAINYAFAWDLQISNYRYGVDNNGNIWAPMPLFNNYGQPILDNYGRQIMQPKIVGYVQRFQ